MKPKSNPFLRSIALTSSILISLAQGAFAGGYQWNGTTNSTWSTASNWVTVSGTYFAQAITAGVGPTGATFAHRLNVLNGAGSPLVYDGSLGTTVYANTASGLRGLAMSSGTAAPASSFTITGGSFSTLGSSAADVIGNSSTSGTTSVLTVNGGTFIGSGAGTVFNFGGASNVSTFNIISGNATLTTLTVSNSGGSGTVNLDGGILAVNKINKASSGTATFNFNGGTLQARQNDTAFISGLNAVNAVSASTIDTAGFNVSINNGISGSGTINKNNGGKLSLTASNSFNGSLVLNSGTLALAPTTATTFAGAISGAGALEIGGTGTVNLTGTNTHGGGTTVLSGANLGGEGSVSGALTFNGTHNQHQRGDGYGRALHQRERLRARCHGSRRRHYRHHRHQLPR
jgi:fibronectin-binding autotransporter adhesin